ncbi:MAG: site-specific integrase [Acidobacteria bacterium]|nr:site-specific integrase [Acidobacteriota bacterium]
MAKGIAVHPANYRATFEDAMKAVVGDYRDRGNRSLADVQRRVEQHLRPYFGGMRLPAISSTKARDYRRHREQEGAAPATINREMAILKRAFRLLAREGRVTSIPHLPMARERNARQGFFSDEQFTALVKHLPGEVAAVVRFAYITGWRIPSEVLTLRWSHVDFVAREVRLDPGTTKNGDGRTFPFTDALESLLKVQKSGHDALCQADRICPHVFQRDGVRISVFRKAWSSACIKAGTPGRIPHDLRRTAVRNLVRAGVPEVIAMRLTGHKTRSVFDRYNIVSPNDLAVAVNRINQAAAALETVIAGSEQGTTPANSGQPNAAVTAADHPILRTA